MKFDDVIIKPLVTEKATAQQQKCNEYFFAVRPAANKNQIRQAVEKLFKVHVTRVHTMKVQGKWKRVGQHMGKRPDWKKAVVQLRENETIQVLEGKV